MHGCWEKVYSILPHGAITKTDEEIGSIMTLKIPQHPVDRGSHDQQPPTKSHRAETRHSKMSRFSSLECSPTAAELSLDPT